MKNTKKILCAAMSGAMLIGLLAGCGSSGSSGSTSGTTSGTASGTTGAISVVSREDGSGTRGAFIELFGVEQKDSSGNKVDNTIDTAEITNSTAVMLTTVAGNDAAIGYISLGSLDDSVKALKIDGAEATVDNIKSGEYKIARPFNIVTKGDVSDVAQDFINFILSDDGQKVIEDNGYISQSSTGAYSANGASGKITVAGSSSVSPVMEKLGEAYEAANKNAQVEIQTSDSTTGVTSTSEGLCDIGMASRALKDSETAAGVSATVIAMDGIAVIVNKNNTIDGLTNEQVCDIYTGKTTDWSEIQ
ncbi:MAG: substrate-binding domain-containing protein [Oscillospiraceae bacterium]|nr:substrate-binding domain-containing protein [Oscillospiraceae bacterium]